jgi:hypothetical protein
MALRNPNPRSEPVDVVLRGIVRSPAEREEAERSIFAQTTTGVVKVDSQIKVISREGPNKNAGH